MLNNKYKNLCLSDYRKIRTPFVFMDETGSINDKSNRFFALGMIKCMQPHFLDYQIRLLRQRRKVFDELKWNSISKYKAQFIKEVIDITELTRGIRFSAMVVNKQDNDFSELFNDNPYTAYQKLTEVLLKRGVKQNEVLTVLADYVTTPEEIHFEVDVKHSINEQFDRLAIAGVHRIDSRGTNLLQINDIYLGAVIYDFKLKHKLVKGDRYKKQILNYLKRKLGVKSFTDGLNIPRFRVDLYDKNKKGPLSKRLTPSVDIIPTPHRKSK
jgi:hypothetical protein